jgi:1,4-dihydroxy-2-naphthoate octaprenyltransferase
MAGTAIATTPPLFATWREIIRSGNIPAGARVDAVSRWLLITRACVFSMTLTSAAIGGLLAAATAEATQWGYFAVAAVGLLLAHASNNMMNDYFDLDAGVDTADYPRALYAPHPILSGLISRSGLQLAILGVLAAGGAIALYLLIVRGAPVAFFTLSGLFLSVFYVAPPLKLKHHGLGEPTVFVVWGPLMICGTYFVTAGTLPSWAWLASLPYALVVMSVLIGKHIDKHDIDASKGIRTLPVLLGVRASRILNQALMVGFYLTVIGLVVAGHLGAGVLLIAFALPRLWQVLAAYSRPRPAAPPAGFRVWPLWYVALAFYHNKLAGGLFVLGLVVNVAFARILA